MSDVWAATNEQPIHPTSAHACITKAAGTHGVKDNVMHLYHFIPFTKGHFMWPFCKDKQEFCMLELHYDYVMICDL